MVPLEIAGLSKRFGATPVLRDVDLAVAAGEFVSLLGPSGCGKSTLLRIIAGLEQPDAGRLSLGGRDLAGVAARDRDLAMVFQSFALYPQMTARENIALPLRARRLTRLQRLLGRLHPGAGARRVAAEIDRQVAAVAATLEIETLLERRPAALSGGQRQRVALGRALVRQPPLLLMDEPLSSLDARLRLQTRDEIAQIQRRFGITCLFVTHDQAEAMAISDRVAVMLRGRIAQLGTPQDIYRNPRSLEVAEFIGTPRINRFEAEADRTGALHIGALPIGLGAPSLAGRSVTVAVRPEGLELAAHGLPATVLRIEDHGADAFLHLDQQGLPVVLRLPVHDRPARGSTVRIRPRASQVLVFDSDGRRHPAALATVIDADA
ncbi:MAG TPA: ABC transporter ATP-binding protein [Roseomonas sp.]